MLMGCSTKLIVIYLFSTAFNEKKNNYEFCYCGGSRKSVTRIMIFCCSCGKIFRQEFQLQVAQTVSEQRRLDAG